MLYLKNLKPNRVFYYFEQLSSIPRGSGNMVAIADGRPQLMGLQDILAYYINYQRDVIYRRTKFDLNGFNKNTTVLRFT